MGKRLNGDERENQLGTAVWASLLGNRQVRMNAKSKLVVELPQAESAPRMTKLWVLAPSYTTKER